MDAKQDSLHCEAEIRRTIREFGVVLTFVDRFLGKYECESDLFRANVRLLICEFRDRCLMNDRDERNWTLNNRTMPDERGPTILDGT